jgi:5-hydroxyisourate hydrolase-like protein (transthyretin family)
MMNRSPKQLYAAARVVLAILSTSSGLGVTPVVVQAQSQTATVQLSTYTGKPTNVVNFSGSGFAPGEAVDVFLGDSATSPWATVTADAEGRIAGENLAIPSQDPGNYQLSFVGRTSQRPAAVGFNVQGFHPWVVLHNYYLQPQAGVGFSGEDFFPGEPVSVYLNTRLSSPLMQVTADANGEFVVENASLPNLTGDNALIFVGQQSQTEVTATFKVAGE